MVTIRETGQRESDRHESLTGRESSGTAALSSKKTPTPTADDVIRDAKRNGMLPSGKK